MKRSVPLLLVCLVAAVFFCCEKEGPQGPAGAPGADGNANAHTFLFTDSASLVWDDGTIELSYDSVFSIPDSIREEGMVLVYLHYHSYPDWWFLVPGLGASAQHTTRLLYNVEALYIIARNPDGSTWTTGTLEPVTKVRVILVPPSQVTQITWRMGQPWIDGEARGER